MQTNYKTNWIKLKQLISNDLDTTSRIIKKRRSVLRSDELGDLIEYLGTRSAYEFLLNAMTELEGKKHYGIFSIRKT